MSKAKLYGWQTRYIPNGKADMRHRKKVYQRGREKNRQPCERPVVPAEQKEGKA